MKILKPLFCLSVLLCAFVVEGMAQNNDAVLKVLSRSLRAYEKMTTLNARQTILLGSAEPGVELLIGQLSGHVCLKRVQADTALGWYFLNEFRQKEMGYITCYAGGQVETFDLKDSLTEREGVDAAFSEWGFSTFDEWRKKVKLYVNRLCMPDSLFERQEDAWLVGEVVLGKDTVIDRCSCYVVENRKTGSRPEFHVDFRRYERLAIAKKEGIPVFLYEHFQRNVAGKPDMDQETQVSLSDWKVNRRVDDSVFRVPIGKSLSVPEDSVVLKVGEVAPDWCLVGVGGDTLALSDLTKRRSVIEFAYVGCGACMRAGQEIQREVLEVCDSSLYDFVCINPLDSFELMSQYVAEKKITYPYLRGDGDIEKRYVISEFPRIFILDEQHRILRIISGYFPGVGTAIRELIE